MPRTGRSMRARRAVRAVVLSSLLALVATGCAFGASSGGGDEVNYSLGPVQFGLDDDGNVSVMVGREFVTPLGPFGIGVGVETGRAERTRDLVVVIRHTVDKQPREDVYQITTNQQLRVVLDGTAVQEFSPGRVLVEAEPGATIAIQPLETGPDGQLRPIAAPAMPQPFLGTWSGSTTRGSGDNKLSVTLRAGTAGTVVGEWEMPDLKCKGTLTMADAGRVPVVLDTVLVSREVIEDPDDECSGDVEYRFQTTRAGKLKVDVLSSSMTASAFGMLARTGQG